MFKGFAVLAAVAMMLVPSASAEGSVTLTASNFNAEVKESGKNAFIKFQAPW